MDRNNNGTGQPDDPYVYKNCVFNGVVSSSNLPKGAIIFKNCVFNSSISSDTLANAVFVNCVFHNSIKLPDFRSNQGYAAAPKPAVHQNIFVNGEKSSIQAFAKKLNAALNPFHDGGNVAKASNFTNSQKPSTSKVACQIGQHSQVIHGNPTSVNMEAVKKEWVQGIPAFENSMMNLKRVKVEIKEESTGTKRIKTEMTKF